MSGLPPSSRRFSRAASTTPGGSAASATIAATSAIPFAPVRRAHPPSSLMEVVPYRRRTLTSQRPKSEVVNIPGSTMRRDEVSVGDCRAAAAASANHPALPTAMNPTISPISSCSRAEMAPKTSVAAPASRMPGTIAPPRGSVMLLESAESSLITIRASAEGIHTPTRSEPTIGSASKILINRPWKGKTPAATMSTMETPSAVPAASDAGVAYEASTAAYEIAVRRISAITTAGSSSETVRRSRKTARARPTSSLPLAAAPEIPKLAKRRSAIGAMPDGIASARSIAAIPKRAICPMVPARRPSPAPTMTAKTMPPSSTSRRPGSEGSMVI